MFKQPLLSALLLLATLTLRAQSASSVRYKDLVFQNIIKTTNLTYSPADTEKEKKAHLFDLYQPKGDTATARPLIIWMHGGGFKFGSKNAAGVELWSETFAKRGYVCVSINYTLSKHYPFLHFDELLRSCYYAVQDARSAVAFFKKNYKEYNIDPDKIILGGNSAGGMIALQTAYSTNAQLAKLAALPDSVASSNQSEPTKVAGVISYWGAIFNLNWLKNAQVPIICVHGSKDGLVPLTNKGTTLYGSLAIHEKADTLKIPNGFRLFEGYSHELQKHFNPVFGAGKKTKERWLEAGQYTADFLYINITK